MTDTPETSRISSEIAHTMRTSLAVIQMNSEVVLINPQIEGETRALLQSNAAEVQKISKIIGELLEKR